jgi:hypothetical protein
MSDIAILRQLTAHHFKLPGPVVYPPPVLIALFPSSLRWRNDRTMVDVYPCSHAPPQLAGFFNARCCSIFDLCSAVGRWPKRGWTVRWIAK